MMVVIVDDDEGILDMVCRMLKQCGINDSIKAKNAKEFYNQLNSQLKEKMVPDLVLLDVMMPEITGHEVLGALKKYELTKPIPIIVMTAAVPLFEKMQKENPIEYEGLLPKPFTKSELVDMICKVICHDTIEEVVKAFSKKEIISKSNGNNTPVNESLQKAWKEISSKPDAKLVKLIADTSKELYGQTLDEEIIKKFVKTKLAIKNV